MAQRKAQATLGFRQTRNASTQDGDEKTSHAAPVRGQPAGRKRKSAATDPTAAKTPVGEGTPRMSTRARKSATVDDHVSEKLENGTDSVQESPKPGNKSRGAAGKSQPVTDQTSPNASPAKTRIKRPPESDNESPYMPEAAPKTTKKAKTNNYGLTPGVTPFPDWPAPYPETCEEVARLLGELHGHVTAPKKIPAPSLQTSGCGEVPSILDALIRTLLSANTTNKNSSSSFRALVERFGVVKKGVGQGSVDWNKVRLADVEEVIETIKHGGLAKVKGNNIKRILDMVYQQNQERREVFLAARETGKALDGEKDLEVLKAKDDVLSLDHMHGMPADQAMEALTKFPGIGVKTASCVILFCMQQPSFAVDTHVWRLCKWLGWVPPAASRDQTFSHCEVRVPDHLKYPLHKLLISHGKTCQRCRAITTQGSEGWAEAKCPIEHLVRRTGKRGKK